MCSIDVLRDKWNNNKEGYKIKETGGGVHDFIADIFGSAELFHLSKTVVKTAQFGTFVHDTESGKEGRPDFVLYINENITIPVEAKCFTHIQEGITQLQRYQLDYSKQYGILTDGNEWRFYRATSYKKLTITEIFDAPNDFRTFWQEYIKPENYYIELFNPSGQQNLFEDQIDLNISEHRTIFFDDTTRLLNNFRVKLKKYGELDLFREQEIETSYAFLIQFILYKVLVDNGYKKFTGEYQQLLRRIKKSIHDCDFYNMIVRDIRGISEYISQKIYKPFAKELEGINEKITENLRVDDLTIDDISPWLDVIVFINKYNFANLKNEIFGFIYENYLKDLYQNKNKGQYFTDPDIVNFMLDELEYTHKKLTANKDNISIIDPSCGAGTFLYSAVDRIVEAFEGKAAETESKIIEDLVSKNIFGLDVAEFPLFLAEMSILMRLLPLIVNDNYENPIDRKLKIFKTKDSISEFLDAGLVEKQTEIDYPTLFAKTGLNYKSFMRDNKDLQEMIESMQGHNGKRMRFDYVIGNPPYIGYNECCKQGVEFTKKIKDKEDTSITMGNVYGVNLNTAVGRIKSYSPKPNLYAFFIALGLGLLKEGGKICYIIPQTVLTAGDLDVIRSYWANNTTIEKIITFEGNLFIGRGLTQNKPIPTSSLIFVATKKKAPQNHIVKVINYQYYTAKQTNNLANYLKSKNKEIKKIPQDKLIRRVENWNFIKQPSFFLDFCDEYTQNTHSIEEYRRLDLANYDEFHFDVGYTLDKKYYTAKSCNHYPILDFKGSVGYTKLYFTNYYPKDESKIQLTANSRYSTLGHKYNIVCRIKNFQQFYLTQEPVIFNMGTASIIASDNKKESLFLFAVLNSIVNNKVLKMNLKIENEKEFQVSFKSIKQYIRIPKIS
ncbi:MAG: N-6 DNA methylase, partial [Planctomycetaceae bacterium]|nr:N-6 DNA methylase [Planctomycetaceae bacterium]